MKLRIFNDFFDREFRVYGSIYFVLAFINLRVKVWLTPAWFNGNLASNHKTFLVMQGANNEQSRILQFWIPELLHRAFSISIEDAYLLQRWVFIFFAFICFHKFLRKWFDSLASFAGVLLLAAIMPLTYFNHLQESAPLLLLTFLLALWAIRDKQIPSLLAVFFIGGMNNETMLILPLVYFTYNLHNWRWRKLALLARETVFVSLPLWLIVGTTRFLTRHNPHGDDPWQLPHNF